MSLLDRPNLLSFLILGFVVLVAGGYGIVTYTQRPDLTHFYVDPDYGFAFDFSRPDRIVDLPKNLQEISGLAPWYQDNEVVAVQDEDGELFVINTLNGKVTKSFKFGKDRDYEGIERIQDSLYVLERDGDIHQLVYREGVAEFDADKMETSFGYRNDTEGIGYDFRKHQLLIVPKEQELNPLNADDSRRGVYSYDLSANALDPAPAYFIDEFEVGDAVYKTPKRYHLKPSGVAVDPITGDIYVIASVGKILVVINRESEIKHIELLQEDIFTQPEGITFDAQGNLFISSEGRGGKAKLATFKRQEPAE
ncbi:MAG: SdiA-regulated domain-containing protein [Bacteroidota bacterium]